MISELNNNRDSGDIDASSHPHGGQHVIAAASLVHDVGNMIQVASSALSLLSRNPEMPRQERETMLAQARTSLDSAGNLVRQGLDRIGYLSQRVEDVSIAACLFDLRDLVDGMGNIEFGLEISIDVDLPKVRCERAGLLTAIIDLVFNAREAMTSRGKVSIEASGLDRSGETRWVNLRVSDRGIGMSPSTIEPAFETFMVTNGDGTGNIGLSMATRFVSDAGGSIFSVESEIGGGTTVTIRLPGVVVDLEASGSSSLVRMPA